MHNRVGQDYAGLRCFVPHTQVTCIRWFVACSVRDNIVGWASAIVGAAFSPRIVSHFSCRVKCSARMAYYLAQ